MKRVVFFTESKWAFGTIHYSLCRRLYERGITAEVLDFFQKYSQEEMAAIGGHTDLFVTTPVGVTWLLEYGIKPSKIVSIAHAQWDILLSNSQIGTGIYDQLAGYAVVSNILRQKSQEFGVTRVPVVLHLGVEFDRFYQQPSRELNIIGFAGAYESRNFAGEEIKRGRLAQQVAERAGTGFRLPNAHYLAMPSFYAGVDAVIQASTEEGAGLPMMEAAAAGRFCLGTAVGYFAENVTGGGIQVPLDEADFVDSCVSWVEQARQNPQFYRMICEQTQAYARDHYDWGHHIAHWADYLLAA